ncbi:MAG: F0F1 ATP synthase subunit A [Gemmataceae bacterium]|nr:F0F1 ATP synthase subunit A [Gemmataceae bacterium]MDW8265125.1 F0F1 ATP synthase subunit A [Gemmataceae bacterium]
MTRPAATAAEARPGWGPSGWRWLASGLLLTILAWKVWSVQAAHTPVEQHHKADTTHHDASDHDDHHDHGPPHRDPFHHLSDSHSWEILNNDYIQLSIDLPRIEGAIVKGLSKFMVLELIAAGAILAIYIPLARRLQDGRPPRGAWDNAFEVLLTFIRNEVAKPNLGDHDADRYVPFLWTLFLFILFNNLLGMLPWMGSATGNLYVTGGLALVAFVMMHGAAIAKMGAWHYLESLWPHMHVPFLMGLFLKPMIFIIELLGTVIKSGVLAVRLFANIFAGHTVLAMILVFIVQSYDAQVHDVVWGTIAGASVLGVVALSLLELFVAFLQSYIFVFLTALFMGMALHPQH